MNKSILRKKKNVLWMMAGALLICSCLFVINFNQAEARTVKTPTDGNGVIYVSYEKSECTLGTAPIYEGVDDEGMGYLFGGWYNETKNGEVTTYTAIKNDTAKESASAIYAKFVPAYVLSVKCQNFAGTGAETTATSMRIVSSVESLNYKKIGFDLIRLQKDNESYTEVSLGEEATQTSTKVYPGFKIYRTADGTDYSRYEANQIFGAASKYLTTCMVSNIENGDFDDIICIKPYWETLDGTKVYGLSRYAHVEDGVYNYINVPINLKNAKDVAAGRLTVTYDGNTLTYKDAEAGRIFADMKVNASVENQIKCVGSLEEITESTSNVASDDIYINLRFTVGALQDGANAFDFTVTNEDFSNVNEDVFNSTDYDVWNVKSAILR